MKILGLGGSRHDLSCCLLENGRIIKAIEAERISREKHALGLRSHMYPHIDYCLENLDFDEIDFIVGNDINIFNIALDNDLINKTLRINHHMAHAASSYYTSGFSEAAILVIDGAGSLYLAAKQPQEEVCSLGYAHDSDINIYQRQYAEKHDFNALRITQEIADARYYGIHINAIGDFYSFFTQFCGFNRLEEGKLMGLAPYGTDRYVSQMKKIFPIKEDGTIESNCLLNGDFNALVKDLIANKISGGLFQIKADFAYAAQNLFEESIFNTLRILHNKTGSKNLCFSGGSALNSVLNGKIKEQTPFENIYIFSAPNDAGTSIGSALYAYYNICRHNFSPKEINHVYLGKTYKEDVIRTHIESFKESIHIESLAMDDVYERVAQQLAQGQIVGWFQDGAEFGPRALGNRSILADPRNGKMKDHINHKVKFREHFRPFAPVVLQEYVHDYFVTQHEFNPFMLFVGAVKKEKINEIPSVTHVDGSARLQTVSSIDNDKLYSLISAFNKITNVPVLLNTSFNIKSQPIVETPHDALEAFLHCDMDLLVIHNYIISKK